MPAPRPYTLASDGRVLWADGAAAGVASVQASEITVPHLEPHVETFALDEHDSVKILIRYSCHCWTAQYDPVLHAGQVQIMDHARPRAFDATRHDASIHLSNLIRALPLNRIYVTRSDRNYGVYNATLPDHDGNFYTAFFTLTNRKGRFDRVRHALTLFVESAYAREQPDGSRTNFKAIVAKARQRQMVKFRR